MAIDGQDAGAATLGYDIGPSITYWTESDYRAHGLDPWKPKAPIERHFVKAAGKLWRVERDGGRREIGEAK